MFKRFLAMLVVLSLVIGLAACSEKPASSEALALTEEPTSKDVDGRVIKRYGQGFLEEKESGLRVLHLKGNAYERGYQRGVLLSPNLDKVIKTQLTWYANLIESGDQEKGFAKMREANKIMKSFMPIEYRRELEGLAAALMDNGSNLTEEDIFMRVTCDDLFLVPSEDTDLNIDHCSSFAASGEATKDGNTIMAGTQDYFETLSNLNERVIAVIDPTDGGYGYTGAYFNGFYGVGMNEAGISVNIQLSESTNQTIYGTPFGALTSMILQYSSSIDDAIKFIKLFPKTWGFNYTVADGKTGEVVVIEASSEQVVVRRPENGKDVIWTTNHYNSYPGFKGYEGESLVSSQLVGHPEKSKLDVSDLEKWQENLDAYGKGKNSRFGRLEQLIEENYGFVDEEVAKDIMMDRYSLSEGRIIPLDEEHHEWDVICVQAGAFEIGSEDDELYKDNEKGPWKLYDGSLWSFVAKPETGIIWWADAGTGAKPPTNINGGFHLINLHEELKRNR